MNIEEVIRQPIYQQMDDRFQDKNYVENTRKEMGSPRCLQKPMYTVGEGSKIPAVFRKAASTAQTILGTVTLIPAIYSTLKGTTEFFCLPVSSSFLRSIFESSRDQAISPPKRSLEKVIEVVKILAKAALIAVTVVSMSQVSLGLGIVGSLGIGVYCFAKHYICKKVADVIKKEYTNHIDKGSRHMRLSVMVDGDLIDAYVVMGNEKIEAGQRWILATNGNGVPAETVVSDLIQTDESKGEGGASLAETNDGTMLRGLHKKLKANVLTYNYGGCLGSEGSISTEKAARIYQAMKTMLEDQQGLAAGQIIFYGHSIGGAFQAVGLKGSEFEENIKYVCVKDRTFASSKEQIENMLFPKLIKFMIRQIGWDINVAEQCDELYEKKIPQVVINSLYDNVIKDSLYLQMFPKYDRLKYLDQEIKHCEEFPKEARTDSGHEKLNKYYEERDSIINDPGYEARNVKREKLLFLKDITIIRGKKASIGDSHMDGPWEKDKAAIAEYIEEALTQR